MESQPDLFAQPHNHVDVQDTTSDLEKETGDWSSHGKILTSRHNLETGPNRRRLASTLLMLCIGAFTVSLDDTIVATAVPRMTDQFHSIADIAWYGSAYLLTMGGTQLLFGKLYVLHVDKTIYISSLLTFAVGSAICATAQSSTMFIVGRAMAGIGAAGQVCGALVIIAHTVPLTMRPLCTSIVGSMTAVGSVAGPLLGGVITSKLSWRWCFYMNLPIMGVLLVLLATFYRPSDQPANHPRAQDWKTRAAQYDPLGNLAFFPVVICFQIALEYGGTEYSWSNARVIVLFVLAAISLVVFIGIQWYMQEHATLPPHVAGQRTVASSAVFIALLGGAYYSAIYYLPLWFQGIKGVSPMMSGVMSIPLLLAMVLSSIGAAGLVTVAGYYNPFALAAPLLAAIGTGMLSTLQPNSGPANWISYQILLGIGIGCGFHQPFIAVQTVLRESEIPTGIGFVICAEMLGGAIGIAASQKLFETRLITSITKMAPDVDQGAILNNGATDMRSLVPENQLGPARRAYNDSVTSTFYLATGLAGASIIAAMCMEWKSIKKDELEDTGQSDEADEPEIVK